MNRQIICATLGAAGLVAILAGASKAPVSQMPYAKAGLTQRQAAAHLLDRFAFGARPGEVDRVVKMGLDNWLNQQLSGKLPDEHVQKELARFKPLTMTGHEIVTTYLPPNVVRNNALRAGIITKEELDSSPAEAKRKIKAYSDQRGFLPEYQLQGSLTAQKLLRAVYSENQLHEVMTDFWFNHFNVSRTDNQARFFIFTYERDAIRPHVLGNFRDMLGATAKHPAMLYYLDNGQSQAPNDATTLLEMKVAQNPRRQARNPRQNARIRQANRRAEAVQMKTPVETMGEEEAVTDLVAEIDGGPPVMAMEMKTPAAPPKRRVKKARMGINENYARELMELHTLGVEGGYSQKDVIEVSRALTGWTIYPFWGNNGPLRRRMERDGERLGFIRSGEFLFRPDTHDAGEKTILGVKFPAGGGMEEGERVLDMLAKHPSTARFISRKFATRFVSDTPPKTLEDRLTKTFLSSNGDIKAMVRTLVASPEFWSPAARRAKIKSPFELMASALRATNAKMYPTTELVNWLGRMGQPIYSYQSPTGFPDKAKAWVNTGSLLSRMNFGLQLASGRIPGVWMNLRALNANREPESVEAALKTYAALLMPERDLNDVVKQLAPVVRDPQYVEKVTQASSAKLPGMTGKGSVPSNTEGMEERTVTSGGRKGSSNVAKFGTDAESNAMLAQVVGVLIGSPEFQRR